MAEPLILVERLVKRYGANTVLDDINLQVTTGQVLVVIGPSGSGKSTLLRCLAALEPIQRGAIRIDGTLAAKGEEEEGQGPNRTSLRVLREKVGMVFQQFNLFPHLTVMENITLAPRRVRGMGQTEAETLAADLLRRVGLEDKRDQHPERLSGGQQQRAAIARALAMHPKVMLFDEVTSALDPELVGELPHGA
jgi:ABC-type polar amino acid transport system ATPase subunit